MNSNPVRIFLVLLAAFAVPVCITGQQQNVPIDHDVYQFLKEMKVKKILAGIHEDSPNMSRYEIRSLLAGIESKASELSTTELALLRKYSVEFNEEKGDSSNTLQLFGGGAGLSSDWSGLLSDKMKYAYLFRNDDANFYLEILGRALYGQNFKPFVNNSELYDIGFRFHGTLFDKLGYSLTVQKGGVSGSQDLAPTFDPRLRYNFKFYEKLENIGNYDFAEGYLRYYTEPAEDMRLAVQIGREKLKFGYGYGGKLVLTGDHPLLDFIRFNFDYGIFSFTSIHASTVGEFHVNREENYTKNIATNRFKLSFEDLFDFGFGETIVYSGRGIDIAYLNPLIFYKFVEMSLQDRDNGLVWLDFQTSAFKNFELQGTFFLDENILSHLQEMDLFSNKTAYQLGAYWYTPFGISDLSLLFEYTKIRPYVYSHYTLKNSYTASSELLGHQIGPNADEILAKAAYNVNEKLRLEFEFRRGRSGENIYDALGNVVFNAGGDASIGHRGTIDPKYIQFLDGERINKTDFKFVVRYEPFREILFDFVYGYRIERNLTRALSFYSGFGMLRMNFNF